MVDNFQGQGGRSWGHEAGVRMGIALGAGGRVLEELPIRTKR